MVDGREAPALKTSESVISLFREDERVKPLFLAFQRFLYSRATTKSLRQMFDPRRFEREKSHCSSLEDLRADIRLPMVMKAWIMQEKFPNDFARMVREYCEIFPSVKNVRVARQEDLLTEAERQDATFAAFQFVDLAIQEEGVLRMVTFGSMSSGMRRTLMHLLELSLAPSGSVVLVDEYENSLGVNCLPSLTEHLLRRSHELQFILTSHHPYVIENIDRKYWKVVTRRAGDVVVREASSFIELNTSSKQSAFIQLLDVLDRLGDP
jgi:predicted ATPase